MDERFDPPAPRRRWPWPLRWLLGALAAVALIVCVAAIGIDSDAGHRLLVDKIASLRIKSGLRIGIGRIDGSVWRHLRIRDLSLSDPHGVFLHAPEVDLDWHPLDWLSNRLTIDRLAADLVVLERAPELRPTGETGPLLPGFDIHLGRLDIAHLRLAAPVSGTPRTGSVHGRAEVRHRSAVVALRIAAGAGDRATIVLDAEPDRDRFDLDMRVASPANGLVGGLVGTQRPLALVVSGDGDWQAWRGAAALDMAGRRTVDLTLAARGGQYRLAGFAAPSPFLGGKLQRLSTPRIAINGHATFADRRLTGSLDVRTPALAGTATGTVDLATSGFDPLTIDLKLVQPAALFPNMTGRDIRLHARLDGPFRTARFAYLLTAPHIQFDDTGFDLVRAEGADRFSRAPVAVPLRLHAARVTGVGDVAGGILADLGVAGTLQVTAKALDGHDLALTSDKLRGALQLHVDLVTGSYDVGVSGALTRYLIPGLGIVDVTTKVSVVPGPGGHGSQVAGRGQAWIRRFDNAFLSGLAGGLPQIDTGLVRTPDGIVHFHGLKLNAPALSISGDGYRRKDGSFHFEGSGRQATYGPLVLLLDGQIDHPHIELKLASPVPALGLSQVSATLDPTPQGFSFRAAGGSRLGPFTTHGAILLPPGKPAVIAIADLAVAGTHASGDLRADPGGFTGTLKVAGGGIDGSLGFAPVGTVQRIEAHLAATAAKLPGASAISLKHGRLNGDAMLDPGGVSIEAKAQAVGIRSGGVFLARFGGSASLRGGAGQVTADLAGSRGREFALHLAAAIDKAGAIRLTGNGSVDRQPIALGQAALLQPEGGGYRLSGATLSYGGGQASVAGRFGTAADALTVTLDRLPLTVLDLLYPHLGLGGAASGRLAYAGGVTPTGSADLTVRGLTRAGLVLNSQPIDLGLAAALDGRGLAARALVASGGRTIGRAQARLAPLGPGEGLLARLATAPLFAQVRYAGPADTIWRLTGIEAIDLSGPISIGADARGTLAHPQIVGTVGTDAGRLESAVTGTVIEKLAMAGRFTGSQLVFDHFTAATPNGGALSGSAKFDFAAANGVGFTVNLNADNALLLNAEDIGAQVSGPLTIRSDGSGGTISGDVKLVKSRFRLGQAAAAAVPRLAVTEINRGDEEVEDKPPSPWRLDLKARASNRIAVSGLGLDSEWRATLGIAGTVDQPKITGQADLIRGGYQFAGRRFDLSRGIIRFTGEVPPDPYLDITAEADITGLSATIRVTGTGQKPEISFQSTPQLPEDELLSRLLFGTSITNLSAPEALQLAAAVASLRSGGGGGLDPINAVRKAAGLDRLRILPADATTGQRTTVAAGKYVTRRIYVEVATDGQGYSATRVEWELTRWLSLLSSISTLGRTSADIRISKDY